MYSIGRLAKAFGLSRSTLLYYDDKGLLKPSSRTAANYRVYTEEDYRRLELIMAYRDAGLSLESIAALLSDKTTGQIESILQSLLVDFNNEILLLKKQQKIALAMLENRQLIKVSDEKNQSKRRKFLHFNNLSEDDLQEWHSHFERAMPERYQDFLQAVERSGKEGFGASDNREQSLNNRHPDMAF